MNHRASPRAIHCVELPALLRMTEGHFGVAFMWEAVARAAFELEPDR